MDKDTPKPPENSTTRDGHTTDKTTVAENAERVSQHEEGFLASRDIHATSDSPSQDLQESQNDAELTDIELLARRMREQEEAALQSQDPKHLLDADQAERLNLRNQNATAPIAPIFPEISDPQTISTLTMADQTVFKGQTQGNDNKLLSSSPGSSYRDPLSVESKLTFTNPELRTASLAPIRNLADQDEQRGDTALKVSVNASVNTQTTVEAPHIEPPKIPLVVLLNLTTQIEKKIAANAAPLLDNTINPTLTTTAEDSTSHNGTLISTLVTGTITDPDGPLSGIAITNLDTANGSWEFSLNGGSSWTTVGAVSGANALLLTGSARLRFVPTTDWSGSATVSYKAWDSSSGSSGTYSDTSVSGGTTAFSTATTSASVTVSAVNDAPTLNATLTANLTTIAEDTSNPTGDAVSAIAGAAINDVDSGAVQGVAITAVDNTNGAWQYKIGAGAWTDIGTVSASQSLLLTDAAELRFVPNADYAGASTITYRAWDRTSGTEGSKVSTTVNGDTTAFSSTQVSGSITVTNINDAPVVNIAVAPVFTAISEDVTNAAGNLVSSIVSTGISDVDSGAVSGLALTAADNTNGTWEFSTNAGSSWSAVGSVSAASALLLRSTDMLRFVPNADYNGTATVTYRAWDQTSGTAGTTANTTTNGGTTAFSSSTVNGTISVTSANDAPVLNTGVTPALTTIVEDTASPSGNTVSTIVSTGISDVDSGAVSGLALTAADNTNGTWEFSTNAGSSWSAVGSVSSASALLLRSTDMLRFVPNADYNGTATITYRAWDQTSGTAGTTANTTTNGGTTAFSSSTVNGTITVTNVNDAPVLNTGITPSLTTIAEDTSSPSGNTVSTIVSTGISDVDSGAVSGLALTAADNTNGTWEFSTNAGSSWSAVGSVSSASALLLRSTDMLRFVPNADYNGTATITYRAWDQTSGTAGTTANTTTNGGTTAFSSSTVNGTITVTAANDAPVLDTGVTPSLTTIVEDTASPSGNTVSTIVSTGISDVDSGAVSGLALTAADNTNGTWEFSTNAGSSWSAVGSVSSASALLLRSTDMLRFVPNANYDGTATITYRAWDQTSGTAGTTANTTTNGGTTAFSSSTVNGTITVTNVNDAPVLDTGVTPSLTTIVEDTASPSGNTVSTIVSTGISDVDSGAASGLALTAADNTNGTWEFSTNAGSTWSAVGSVSSASALLLRSTDMLRFVPNAEYSGTATITYRAWDQTSGTAGTTANTTTNGGTTAFSSSTVNGTITVTAANDAPVLDTGVTPSLTTIVEDTSNPSGNTVSTIVSTGISDVDSGAVSGLALTAADNTNGTWEFSTNAGSSWSAVGSVSSASALLLRSTDMLRFVPNADYNGTATITYRAWDQTSGTAGATANTTTNGGTTAFSSSTVNGTISVTAANDAPVLDTGVTPALTTIVEDTASPSGNTVSTIVSTGISDVDSGAVSGLALTAADNTNGTWEFSTNAGSSWSAVGSVSSASALLLRSTDMLRFVPNADYNGTATITYRAWDQTSGTAGTTANTTTNGGTTAFSSSTVNGTITVTNVNDAPVLNAGVTPALTTIAEDTASPSGNTVSTIVSTGISDVDSGAVSGLALTAADNTNGTWEFSTNAGSSWSAVGSVSSASALLLRSTDMLRFVPNADYNGTATITYRAWDQTSGTAGTTANTTTNGGTTAFSSSTVNGTITVTAANDAPVLDTGITPSLTTIVEDTSSPSGNTVSTIVSTGISDVDSGAVSGLALTAADNTNGTWQFSTNAGSSWSAVGSVSSASALLLRSTDMLRFVPNANYDGTATITYRAWDQTSGTAGTTADTTTNGGTTAFSNSTVNGTITVTNVNDAPVLNTGVSPTVDKFNYVSTMTNSGITDVDSGATQGIAVTSVSTAVGTWEYSTDNGSSWTAVGAVSTSSALLLRSTDLMRFVPTSGSTGAATLTYQAWDQTAGTVGTKVSVTTNGGTTAFSTATVTGSYNVTAVPTTITASTYVDGTKGFYIQGAASSNFGDAVSFAGDVNNDGYMDFIVSAPLRNTNAGQSLLVFGKSGGWSTSTNISAFTSTTGVVFNGSTANKDFLGQRDGVSAGDFNGDGYADLLIGSHSTDFLDDQSFYSNAGRAYIVFGGTTWSNSYSLSDAALNGSSTSALIGYNGYRMGYSVTSVGDVNGDGYDDMLIGSNATGYSYFYYGRANFLILDLPYSDNLGAISATKGAIFQGTAASQAGTRVTAIGDINGDGYNDFLIAASQFNVTGSNKEGRLYVVLGSASNYGGGFINVNTWTDTRGIVIDGSGVNLQLGTSVGGGGDVNRDGYDDFFATSASTMSYLFFGKSSWHATTSGADFNISSINGTNGFAIRTAAAVSSIDIAGDFNGDGYADIMIGMESFNTNAGRVAVVFGKASGWGTTLDTTALNGTTGFYIDGDASSRFGRSVNSAGDINGDGYDDLIVGASTAATNAGQSYIIYGRDWTYSNTWTGTSGNDTYTSNSVADNRLDGGAGNDTIYGTTSGSNTIIGGVGDDYLDGRGNNNVLIGGSGNDTFVFRSGDYIDGGTGTDVLMVGANDGNIDFTTLMPNQIRNIEQINLTGSGNNTVTFNTADVNDMTSSGHTLYVLGDGAGDRVIATGGWSNAGTSGGYTRYTYGSIDLYVQSTLTQTVS